MAGLVRRLMISLSSGIQAGYSVARRTFEDPMGDYLQRDWLDVQARYSLLWAYFDNAMFDRTAAFGNAFMWSQYKSTYSLYRNIRLIYNPVTRLVNFYAGQVYPGILSASGELPDGIPNAIPLGEDTPTVLREAIGQFWQWSNWQAKKSVLVRYGAALGSVLVEVTDDLEHGKVSGTIIWPGKVANLVLDSADNVKAYALEYGAYDDVNSQTYTFRKEVDGNEFRYFKDGQPFNYNGNGASVPNPYGFVPAVWIKHNDTGSDIGSPAITGSVPKIDELNNLASHTHDQIHKVIGAPIVLWTDSTLRNLFGTSKRGATDDLPEQSSEQESVLMLKGGAGGRVESLAGNLDIPSALASMDGMIKEIEKNHPELTVFEKLQEMSAVTGPAVSRIVAPTVARLIEAQAMYDQASIKLFQMAVAIGGMRASSGAWGALNRQQQKFASFNLDSYTRGDLDFKITPRPLVIPTPLEQMQENQAFWQAVKLAVDAGVPLEVVLRKMGWSEEEIAQLEPAILAKIKRDQMLAQQDVIPQIGMNGQPNPALTNGRQGGNNG